MATEDFKKESAKDDHKLLEVLSLRPGDDERTTISKKVSWILRHGAKRVEIDISKDGWVKMSDLMTSEFMKDLGEDKIKAVIEESNVQKKRYELSQDGEYIRAISKVMGAEKVAKGLAKGGGNQSGNRKKEKSERKSADKEAPPAPPAEGQTKMRPDAPAFVPNPNASAMPAMGYPTAPYGFPYPFGMMPMAYGVPGYGVPTAKGGKGGANQQFHGWIKSFNNEKGFGFIECPEAYLLYGRDVFLHKDHRGDLAVGAAVTFSVETNKRNMPQAKDIQANPNGKGGKSGKAKGKGKGKKEKKERTGSKESKDDEEAEKKDGEEGKEDKADDGDAKVEDAKDEEKKEE